MICIATKRICTVEDKKNDRVISGRQIAFDAIDCVLFSKDVSYIFQLH